MSKSPLHLRASVAPALAVDRALGVIRGAAVITRGRTKPSAGDGSMLNVDDLTLKQVADLINAKPTRVRLGHVELDGVSDDLKHRIAWIESARVDGDTVRADLRFLSPADPDTVRVLAIAEEDPTALGLSITTSRFSVEPPDLLLRVHELSAVDIVGEPAANPTGLLSAKQHKGLMTMVFNDEQLAAMMEMGMSEGGDAEAFYNGLDDDQKATVDGMGKPVGDDAGQLDGGPQNLSAARPARSSVAADPLVLAERQRTASILGMASKAGLDTAWSQRMISSGTSATDAAALALSSMNREPKHMTTAQTRVGENLNLSTLKPAIVDAIGERMGRGKMKDAHPRVEEFRGRSLIEIGRVWLAAHGERDAYKWSAAQVGAKLMNSRSIALAASTSDYPSILADALGKRLRNAYAEYPATWAAWAGRTTTPDFKSIKRPALHSLSDLQEIPEGDEYTFKSMQESQQTYEVKTYGIGTRLTRQMLVNDDLSAFDRLPQMAVAAARRLEDDLVYAQLTSNPTMAEDNAALFVTAHANIGTGAITNGAVSAGRVKMALQTDLEGATLHLRPATLLVPVTIEDTARQLVAAQELRNTASDTEYMVNTYSFLKSLQVVADPRLDANSTAEWYLASSPDQIDTVEVAFLEGEETPVVEEQEDFNSDVRQMKVRHTVGARVIDFRGLFRSTGS